eukprot:scaffold112259_cov59-Phaeocystis_antarctica.AAC.4
MESDRNEASARMQRPPWFGSPFLNSGISRTTAARCTAESRISFSSSLSSKAVLFKGQTSATSSERCSLYSFLLGGPVFGASHVSSKKVRIASSVSPSGRPAFGVMSIPVSLACCSEDESSTSFFGRELAEPLAPASAAAACAGAESGDGLAPSAAGDSSEAWLSASSLDIRRLARSRAARRAFSRKERPAPF